MTTLIPPRLRKATPEIRLQAAEELLTGIPDGEITEAFRAELLQRGEDVRRGRVEARTWTQIKRALRT